MTVLTRGLVNVAIGVCLILAVLNVVMGTRQGVLASLVGILSFSIIKVVTLK